MRREALKIRMMDRSIERRENFSFFPKGKLNSLEPEKLLKEKEIFPQEAM